LPLSPVLYTLYLAELLNQDCTRCFGYVDDVCIYRATHTLDRNVTLLGEDMRAVNEWGVAHKVVFGPEKLEMIHLTRKREYCPLDCKVSENQTITPVAEASDGNQTALRWLGVWFDRKLSLGDMWTPELPLHRRLPATYKASQTLATDPLLQPCARPSRRACCRHCCMALKRGTRDEQKTEEPYGTQRTRSAPVSVRGSTH
jgi:hypothetical protein